MCLSYRSLALQILDILSMVKLLYKQMIYTHRVNGPNVTRGTEIHSDITHDSTMGDCDRITFRSILLGERVYSVHRQPQLRGSEMVGVETRAERCGRACIWRFSCASSL